MEMLRSPGHLAGGRPSPRRWSRGDTVAIGPYDPNVVGIVMRAPKAGSWADVLWIQARAGGLANWHKRQPDTSGLEKASGAQRALARLFLLLHGGV
jgi:hypothetical protein